MVQAGKEIHQNYLDTFYRCITETSMICHDMVEEHKIVYIMSGKLTLRCGNRKVDVKNGQAVYVRKNHLVKEYKQPGAAGEPFKGLFLHLNAAELREMESQIDVPTVRLDESIKRELAITLSPHPFLRGLFLSLDQYFSSSASIPAPLIKTKVRETVIILLQIMPELAPLLFDFSKEWRTDLRAFMEKSFLNDMSIEQLAHYSGRSLSGFKREFQDIYHVSPHKWILNRRLDYAHSLIMRGKCNIAEVYIKAGFKSSTHFITVFRKKYGLPPATMAQELNRM